MSSVCYAVGMSGYTHAVVGANAVWVAALLGMVDERAWLLALAGALAALLPDIDAREAKIHHLGKGALGAFRGAFQHRGFFHSLMAVAVVFGLSFTFLRAYHPLLPFIIALGYASHPIIDGLNFKGVRYLFPMRRMFHLVPKWLASPVRGWYDQLFFIVGLVGIALFFLTHYATFIQTI